MSTTVSGNYYGDEQTTMFQTRISTAVDMLNLQRKLADEQETGGCYGDLYEDLREWALSKELWVSLFVDLFEGEKDIIFELKVIIMKKDNFKDKIVSEEILGHIIKELKTHFGWEYLYPDYALDDKVVKLIK
jgi:hypothetical protein